MENWQRKPNKVNKCYFFFSRCEMFDAMTTSCSAVVSSEDRLERAEDCRPRVMALASEHEQSDHEQCRDLNTEQQVRR